MRISFDLDDTLICYGTGTPCEPNRAPWLLAWSRPRTAPPRRSRTDANIGSKRLGTVGLHHFIPSAVGGEVVALVVRRPHRRVVNQTIHERELFHNPRERHPSKNPGAFGIDCMWIRKGLRRKAGGTGSPWSWWRRTDEAWTEKGVGGDETHCRRSARVVNCLLPRVFGRLQQVCFWAPSSSGASAPGRRSARSCVLPVIRRERRLFQTRYPGGSMGHR